ncbi:MAG: biotin/lipoyl-binding protein [Gemmatimonadales bacterium]
MTRWAIAGLLALGACRNGTDDGVLARGTIEVPEVDLAPMVGARVVTIRVDEGDTVAPGDTVAILTQTELPPRSRRRKRGSTRPGPSSPICRRVRARRRSDKPRRPSRPRRPRRSGQPRTPSGSARWEREAR